jgi:hypothetical protein
VFFALPFVLVFKISFADQVMASRRTRRSSR